MPFLSNNMPSNIFYTSFGSELLRIARSTTEKEDFMTDCCSLGSRMFAQGAELSRARKSFVKLYRKHQSAFEPFFESLPSFLDKLLWGV